MRIIHLGSIKGEFIFIFAHIMCTNIRAVAILLTYFEVIEFYWFQYASLKLCAFSRSVKQAMGFQFIVVKYILAYFAI